jgi:hypothetical protein
MNCINGSGTSKVNRNRLSLGPPLDDPSQRVDMPANETAAELVAEP